MMRLVLTKLGDIIFIVSIIAVSFCFAFIGLALK